MKKGPTRYPLVSPNKFNIGDEVVVAERWPGKVTYIRYGDREDPMNKYRVRDNKTGDIKFWDEPSLSRVSTGIPIGKALQSDPFEDPNDPKGAKLIMVNNGRGLVDSYAVYMFSMGGPGGTPLWVQRDGRWRSYLNKNYYASEAESRKLDEVAAKISAKDYHE